MTTKMTRAAGLPTRAPKAKLSPQVIAALLHRRKQYEDELAAMGLDPKIVGAVTAPGASYRGGSLKQHVLNSAGVIDQIDRMLASDRIQLPKPIDWWTPKAPR